jgi:hypothetical protein
MACNNQTSLFGSSDKYIKFLNGDLVAIEGVNTVERQFLKDLRISYAQLLKGRIILKAGQVDYLMNHLGLGDNATLLSITAIYDPKSKIEEDNYVQYSYYNNLTQNLYLAQLLILTGNSTHRIPQLYLTNPNAKYPVTLEVMVGVIDDNYTFFNDDVNQSGLSFTGLELLDIHTHVIGESIVIKDKSTTPKPLIYFRIANISSIERDMAILIVDDLSKGTIFLKFKTETDAIQAFSLFNYVLENPNVNIDDGLIINNSFDTVSPTINFDGIVSGSGNTFSASIPLSYGTLDKNNLYNLLISSVSDNRDGTMSGTGSNLTILGSTNSATYSLITASGSYSVGFDFSDLAQNKTSNIVLNLTIS